jgi:hypothetical protein
MAGASPAFARNAARSSERQPNGNSTRTSAPVTARWMFPHFPAADLLDPLRRDFLISGLDAREVSELLGSLRAAAIDARRAGAAAVVVPARRNRIFRLFDVITVVHEALPRFAKRVEFTPDAEIGSRETTASTRRNPE